MEVFDTIYRENLDRLKEANLLNRSKALDLQIVSGKITISFFGRIHIISKHGVTDSNGIEPTPAVGTVILNYVLRNEAIVPPSHEKVSFRDFKNAGPLTMSFASNTNRLIARTFSGRLRALISACKDLCGEPATDLIAADLFMEFPALPHIPVYLSFNDRDEDLPAQSNLLFDKSVEHYLDLKSIFVIGTFLAGSLINQDL